MAADGFRGIWPGARCATMVHNAGRLRVAPSDSKELSRYGTPTCRDLKEGSSFLPSAACRTYSYGKSYAYTIPPCSHTHRMPNQPAVDGLSATNMNFLFEMSAHSETGSSSVKQCPIIARALGLCHQTSPHAIASWVPRLAHCGADQHFSRNSTA